MNRHATLLLCSLAFAACSRGGQVRPAPPPAPPPLALEDRLRNELVHFCTVGDTPFDPATLGAERDAAVAWLARVVRDGLPRERLAREVAAEVELQRLAHRRAMARPPEANGPPGGVRPAPDPDRAAVDIGRRLDTFTRLRAVSLLLRLQPEERPRHCAAARAAGPRVAERLGDLCPAGPD